MTESEYQQLTHYILSPGDIYWKKQSSDVLISGKNDMVNHEMIKKLRDAGCTLEIKNRISMEAINEVDRDYRFYKDKKLLKDKINIRNRILKSLKINFVFEHSDQTVLNHLCLILFSKIEKKRLDNFINRDFSFFIRTLNIASSYTIVAYVLGYHDISFLEDLFNNTINDLMELTENTSINHLKNQLEKIRLKTSLTREDRELLTPFLQKNNKTFIFEKLDGNGLRRIDSSLMNDLEIVFCTLCAYYAYEESNEEINILNQICKNKFLLNKRLANGIKSNLGVSIHDY